MMKRKRCCDKNSNNLLRINMRRVLVNPFFILAVCLQTIAFLIFALSEYKTLGILKDQYLYLLDGTCSVGIGMLVIPILSVLPMVSVKDMVGQWDYFTLLRSSKKSYMLAEILSAILSGFLVTFFAGLLFLSILFLLGYRGIGFGIGGTLESSTYSFSCLNGCLIQSKTEIILLLRIVVLSFYSAGWPLILLIISQISINKYLLLIGPFLVGKIWSIIVVPLGIQKYVDPLWQVLYYSAAARALTGARVMYEYAFHVVNIVMLSLIYAMMFRHRLKMN